MSDWRVDNARHTKGFAFAWRKYIAPRPTWDHDHCEGCMAKFAEFEDPEILREGNASDARYKNRPGYYDWVCAECFNDLKDEMNWTEAGLS
ncbi:MAG: hypothetical protein WBQ17_03575 [Rhizomicrobium sp.]